MLSMFRLFILIGFSVFLIAPLSRAEAVSNSAACRVLAASIRAETTPAKRQAKQKDYDTRCRAQAPVVRERSEVAGKPATPKKLAGQSVQPGKKKRVSAKGSKGKNWPLKNGLRPKSPILPQSVTVTPSTGGIEAAINKVAVDGIVWVEAGTYYAPSYVSKNVRIFGVSDKFGNRPKIFGGISVYAKNVSIDNFDIVKRPDQAAGFFSLITIPSGSKVVLSNVLLDARDCVRKNENIFGTVSVYGELHINYSTVKSGRCYAIGSVGGVVSSFQLNIETTDTFAIVQSAGNSVFSNLNVVSMVAIHLQDGASSNIANSKITTKRGYAWWSKSGDAASLRVDKNVLLQN